MERKITLDVNLDELQMEHLQDIIDGNNGLKHFDINNDDDLRNLLAACLTCGIIREARDARERKEIFSNP